MKEEILVACIGNIFLGDDGFGVEVAQALANSATPAGVEVRDFGIRGFDLAWTLVEPWRIVILVDAIHRGGQPGTLYLLKPAEQAASGSPAALDPHGMHPDQVLALAHSFGRITAEVFIVGCEPLDFGDDMEGRMGLSPPVAEAVLSAVKMILEVAAKHSQAAEPLCPGSA